MKKINKILFLLIGLLYITNIGYSQNISCEENKVQRTIYCNTESLSLINFTKNSPTVFLIQSYKSDTKSYSFNLMMLSDSIKYLLTSHATIVTERNKFIIPLYYVMTKQHFHNHTLQLYDIGLNKKQMNIISSSSFAYIVINKDVYYIPENGLSLTKQLMYISKKYDK